MKRGQKVQNLAYLFPSLFKAEFAVELEIFVLFLCLVHHGLDQVLSCSHRHHEQRCQNGSNLGWHLIGICSLFLSIPLIASLPEELREQCPTSRI